MSVLSLLLVFQVSVAAVAHAGAGAAVGEVSLVLGKAWRYSAAGEKIELERGLTISVGDSIETQSNGHVHVRFIDDALVSVRPNSHLFIQRYDYDPAHPEVSAVKFDLQEGVTRAISGDAAKAARDRFRLNTPIAAIGVRGTDFVVSADAETTRALVNEGAIVMAPFSDVCSIDALGPCVVNALELTDDSLQLAAVDQSAPLPRMLPPQSVRAPDMMQEEIQMAIAGASTSEMPATTAAAPATTSSADTQTDSDEDVNNEVLLEGVTTVQVRAGAEVAAETVASTDFIPVDPIAVAADGTVTQFNYTPPTLLSSTDLASRQLVWGRYADSPLATDRLALPFEEAFESRNITVGTLDYGLFRAEPGPRRVASDLGLVGFRLTSAQAVFNSQTGIVAMSVEGGSLDIDFQNSSFMTALDLSSELTGQVDFSASGQLVDGGFLRAFEATQSLTGAVSFDGSEAGYQFEKVLEAGKVTGLTLWDSQ